ncbi:thioredoxin family protein [Thalassotalea atypica]|uniref:thioredoxin family protein n=1 Tax=Thalassotalea atypica TaxID=2054316 RepID=UPI0025744832|nr:thioredoxin family protein [Thalassotalea atypica]
MYKTYCFLLVFLSGQLFASTPESHAQKVAESLPLFSKIYDDKRDPFKDAVAAIELAKKTNRNVLIEIGGNWCTWCHKMDAFLDKNPDVYYALHTEFVVLKVNVSDSNENEAFMKGLPPVLGYPHMYVSTNAGKMVLSKDTAELQENGQYSKSNWLSFIDKWKPEKEDNIVSSTTAL